MIDALITGRLCRAAVWRNSDNEPGKACVTFLIEVASANGEPFAVSCIAFNEVAEHVHRLGIGDSVALTGILKPAVWIERNSGLQKHGLNLTVQAVLTPYDVKRRKYGMDVPTSSKNATTGRIGGFLDYDYGH